MALQDRKWRLIREEARSGAMNMALDEIAARTAADGGPRTARVYSWSPSTLSMGYQQDPDTVDWEFCQREGIDVIRRQTGGGGIYHDEFGDVSYSIVAPSAELPGDLMASYSILMETVLDAFDRMDVDASYVSEERPAIYEPACYLRALHPAHDVVAGGRKISGNAQYRQRDAIIQHGSLTFESLPRRHLNVFTDRETSSAEFSGRITSIVEQSGIDRSEAVEALESSLADWSDATEGEWTDSELAAARELAETKYESVEWNRDRVDSTA